VVSDLQARQRRAADAAEQALRLARIAAADEATYPAAAHVVHGSRVALVLAGAPLRA
jgi:hypothetical protein